MIALLKIYLPIFLIIYALIVFALPSYRTFRQTRINPITFGKRDNAHDYIGLVMKAIMGMIVAAIAMFSLCIKCWEYLGELSILEARWIKVIGLVLMHFSLLIIVLAQYQMGKSWRIGIDEHNRTELVTNGIFRWSRNPIFLGMLLTIFGLFLVLPNVITFFSAFGSYFIIQIQIRLEEEFLKAEHGKAYLDYVQRTPRLLIQKHKKNAK